MTSGRSDLIDITAILLHETDKAIRIDAGIGDPVWLPKSQCEFEKGRGAEIIVTLRESLAREKGLI